MKLFYEYQRPYNGKECPVIRGWINPEKVISIEESEDEGAKFTVVHLESGEWRRFEKPIEDVFSLIFNIGPANAENPETVATERLKRWVDAQKANGNKR